MDLTQTTFTDLAISLGLGLLVGLQRERGTARLAGFRTFAITTLLGTLCGLVALTHGGWIVGAGLISVAAVLVVGNLMVPRPDANSAGLTTEVAMLAMFSVGALLATGPRPLAVALGGAVAVLLHFKGELHGIAKRLGDTDVRAIMQFALVSLVILPALPDQTFDPFDVVNPRQVWFMVVLIVGINLVGYLAARLLAGTAGTVLTGIFGGFVSSTATTVSYSRLAKSEAVATRTAAIVILLSSSFVFLRLLFEMLVVSRTLFQAALVPCLILFGAMGALSMVFWRRQQPQALGEISGRNPTELPSALAFGALYATVLFVVAAVKQIFGDDYLYAVAAVSGLSKLDPITLSTAQLVNAGRIDAAFGWRMVVIAAVSNLVSKLAIVAILGERQLVAYVAPLFGLVMIIGVGLLWLLP